MPAANVDLLRGQIIARDKACCKRIGIILAILGIAILALFVIASVIYFSIVLTSTCYRGCQKHCTISCCSTCYQACWKLHWSLCTENCSQKFFEACYRGDNARIRSLLIGEQMAALNNATYNVKLGQINGEKTGVNLTGMTCLMFAAWQGRLDTVQIMIRDFQQANAVDQQREDGRTALHLATVNDHLETVRLLRQEGRANFEIRESIDGDTPLLFAAERGRYEIAKYMLNEGATVNQRNFAGRTALALASDTTMHDLIKDYGGVM